MEADRKGGKLSPPFPFQLFLPIGNIGRYNFKNQRGKVPKIRREEFYKQEKKSAKNKRTKALNIRYTKKINRKNNSYLLTEKRRRVLWKVFFQS